MLYRGMLLVSASLVALMSLQVASAAGDVDSKKQRKESVEKVSKEVEELRHEVELLKAENKFLNSKADKIAADNSVLDKEVKSRTKPPKEDYFRIPKTDFFLRFYGFVKVSASYDKHAVADDRTAYYTFSPKYMALPNGVRANRSDSLRIYARETRIGFDSFYMLRKPDGSEMPFEGRVEMDFQGSAITEEAASTESKLIPRLRKAYAAVAGFKFGLEQSMFSDKDSGIDTVDFNGPTGTCNIRQCLISYTKIFKNGMSVYGGFENPEGADFTDGSTDFSPTKETTNGHVALDRVPDVVLGTQYDDGYLHMRVTGLLREMRAVAVRDSAKTAKTTGYGATASFGYKYSGRSKFYVLGVTGKGVGRYISDNIGFGAFLDGNKLRAINAWSLSLGIQHFWNEKYSIRTNLAWGISRLNLPKNMYSAIKKGSENNWDSFSAQKEIKTIHANVMASPWGPSIDVGFEYLRCDKKSKGVNPALLSNGGKTEGYKQAIDRFAICFQAKFNS